MMKLILVTVAAIMGVASACDTPDDPMQQCTNYCVALGVKEAGSCVAFNMMREAWSDNQCVESIHVLENCFWQCIEEGTVEKEDFSMRKKRASRSSSKESFLKERMSATLRKKSVTKRESWGSAVTRMEKIADNVVFFSICRGCDMISPTRVCFPEVNKLPGFRGICGTQCYASLIKRKPECEGAEDFLAEQGKSCTPSEEASIAFNWGFEIVRSINTAVDCICGDY